MGVGRQVEERPTGPMTHATLTHAALTHASTDEDGLDLTLYTHGYSLSLSPARGGGHRSARSLNPLTPR
jgi:hypothetical protein